MRSMGGKATNDGQPVHGPLVQQPKTRVPSGPRLDGTDQSDRSEAQGAPCRTYRLGLSMVFYLGRVLALRLYWLRHGSPVLDWVLLFCCRGSGWLRADSDGFPSGVEDATARSVWGLLTVQSHHGLDDVARLRFAETGDRTRQDEQLTHSRSRRSRVSASLLRAAGSR